MTSFPTIPKTTARPVDGYVAPQLPSATHSITSDRHKDANASLWLRARTGKTANMNVSRIYVQRDSSSLDLMAHWPNGRKINYVGTPI
jgi:hypothetical protein